MSQSSNPYESPQLIEAAPWESGRRRITAFASGHTRAMFAVGLLAACALVHALVILLQFSSYNLLSGIKLGRAVTPDEATSLRERVELTQSLYYGVFAFTVIVFLMWVHRANRNLPALETMGREFTPAWSVGCFFVPIANLVWPYQAMVEIARGSDPQQGSVGDHTWQRPRSSPLVPLWWTAFLIRGFAGWLVSVNAAGVSSVDSAMTATLSIIALNIVSIVAAGLAIAMVLMIDGRQTERYRWLCEHPQPVISPVTAAIPAQLEGFLDRLG